MAADDFRDEGLQGFYDSISKVAAMTLDKRMENDSSALSEFDSYRSLAVATITIIVAKDVVPPFRFKAGGWEFLRTLTQIGQLAEDRIAQKGFFMFRANEDGATWAELTDLPSGSQNCEAGIQEDAIDDYAEKLTGDRTALHAKSSSIG
jgi:hypothetical protein